MDILIFDYIIRLITIFLSFTLYYTLDKLLLCYLPLSLVVKRKSQSKKTLLKQYWRLRNTILSSIHSLTSGLFSLYCFYENPKLIDDLINECNLSIAVSVACSTEKILPDDFLRIILGYFFHDIHHMLSASQTRQTLELILHHVVVIACFGLSLITNRFIGYAIVALLVEVNSVFLHLRQMLQLLHFRKDSPIYKIVALCNVGTFILFRIATFAWMTRWLVLNRDEVGGFFYTIGATGLVIMNVMSVILFYRIIQADFVQNKFINSAVPSPDLDPDQSESINLDVQTTEKITDFDAST